MGRKVFISFLGASNYKECDYTREGISYGKVRFIQEATINYLKVKQEWTENDAIYILLTKTSESNNWINNGQLHYSTHEPIEQDGLCTRLNNMHLKTPVHPIKDIPDGNNEQEIWVIFEQIFGLIQENDELYFDLTHGYRYLPMLMLVLGNYSKFLKHVTIRSITYGNYEISDGGKAPGLIVDFLPLSQLQDWATAAATLKIHGKHSELSSSVSNEANTNQYITKLNQNLLSFEQEISTCRGIKLYEGKSVQDFRAHYKRVVKNTSLPAPVKTILQEVNQQLEPFQCNSLDNLRNAIKWCIRHKMPQQAYTLTQESIITILRDKFKAYNPFNSERKFRDYFSSILGANSNVISDEKQWKNDMSKYRELTRSFIAMPWVKNLRIKYGNLQAKRNQINHGGFVGDLDVKTIYKNMESIINPCFEIIDGDISEPIISPNAGNIFINLSNHPSELWSKEQIEAVQEYGEIVDVPFPDMRPDADDTTIMALVDEYIEKVLELAQSKTATVHLMGEMTLTFALVKRLQAMGVKCIASTTERIATQDLDGTKHVKFNFCKFRDYE